MRCRCPRCSGSEEEPVGWQVMNGVVLHAGNTIINPNGIFVYDGPPATGNLIIALAPAAGADEFANAFIKGIQVGEATDTAQVELVPGGGGASQVQFPIPALALSNTPNLAGGVISGVYAASVMSGPALAAAGQRDWTQIIQYSNDTVGDQARMEFRYIDTNGAVTTIAAMNGNTGWTFHDTVSIDAGFGPFVTGESYHTVSLASGATGLLSGGIGMRVKKMPWNAV